jgi:hypothetical protein
MANPLRVSGLRHELLPGLQAAGDPPSVRATEQRPQVRPAEDLPKRVCCLTRERTGEITSFVRGLASPTPSPEHSRGSSGSGEPIEAFGKLQDRFPCARIGQLPSYLPRLLGTAPPAPAATVSGSAGSPPPMAPLISASPAPCAPSANPRRGSARKTSSLARRRTGMPNTWLRTRRCRAGCGRGQASPDRRLVDLEGSVEHVLAADVEQEIAKIMVPVRPGGTIVIEDAVDGVGLRIERQIGSPWTRARSRAATGIPS